ncbi:hypothetical protein ACHAWU_004656 [Discostella pseudostelligera]|uniref:SAM domain-containing protein n=1 Tax=Discostella pseudostelligera TaxID=259834 RepID=A0ABD3N7Q6_9STRA
MVLKPINQYTVEEVGMWLTAQGLGDHASTFIDAGVDGDVLVSLDVNDLKNDLFLSGLQAKKVLSNIEFSKGMTVGGTNGSHHGDANNERTHQLEHKVKKLEKDLQSKDEEIAELNRKLARLECNEAARHHQPTPTQQSYQPQPTQTYYSQPTAPPPKPSQPPAGARVVGGAARGAAGGAVKGAIGKRP